MSQSMSIHNTRCPRCPLSQAHASIWRMQGGTARTFTTPPPLFCRSTLGSAVPTSDIFGSFPKSGIFVQVPSRTAPEVRYLRLLCDCVADLADRDRSRSQVSSSSSVADRSRSQVSSPALILRTAPEVMYLRPDSSSVADRSRSQVSSSQPTE